MPNITIELKDNVWISRCGDIRREADNKGDAIQAVRDALAEKDKPKRRKPTAVPA